MYIAIDISQDYTFKYFVKKFNFSPNCGSMGLDTFVDSVDFSVYMNDPDVSSLSLFSNLVTFKSAETFETSGSFTTAGVYSKTKLLVKENDANEAYYQTWFPDVRCGNDILRGVYQSTVSLCGVGKYTILNTDNMVINIKLNYGFFR